MSCSLQPTNDRMGAQQARFTELVASGLISERDLAALQSGKPYHTRQQVVQQQHHQQQQRQQQMSAGEELRIGSFPMPFSIATNFIINGKDMLIPMVQEEASVVAAASNAAKSARDTGGFHGSVTYLPLKAKIICRGCDADVDQRIAERKDEIAQVANKHYQQHSHVLQSPFVDISAAAAATGRNVACITLTLDIEDAGLLRDVAMACVPLIVEATRGQLVSCVVPTAQPRMLVKVRGVWRKSEVCKKGEAALTTILDGWAFARADIFRATTHNKGIMNGIEAVVRATGNEPSTVEASIHHGASQTFHACKYTSLTHYSLTDTGDLLGDIHIQLPLLKLNHSLDDVAGVACRLMGVQSSEELGLALGAVGLAQNMAALWALATDGIQQGHMRLHANNVAVMGGAKTDAEITAVVARMVKDTNVSVSHAQAILAEIRASESANNQRDSFDTSVNMVQV